MFVDIPHDLKKMETILLSDVIERFSNGVVWINFVDPVGEHDHNGQIVIEKDT